MISTRSFLTPLDSSSVDQRATGEPQEDVFERATSHKARDRVDAAPMNFAKGFFAIVVVDQNAVR